MMILAIILPNDPELYKYTENGRVYCSLMI